MFRSTPLAWNNLTADWRRLLLGAAGVAFASVLMFMQNGFRNALLDSPIQMINGINCDLVAISRARYALPSEQRFSCKLLDRAASDPDVLQVDPVFIEVSRAQVRVDQHRRRPIRVVAAPLRAELFEAIDVQRQLELLRVNGTALLDRRTRSGFGFATDNTKLLQEQSVELLGKKIRLAGLVEVGTDFAHDGTMIMSPTTFAQYFSFRGSYQPLQTADLGLIQLRDGTDPEAVSRRLTALAPEVWEVMTKQEIVSREILFWNSQTPIGMIFFIGSVMGFAVGVIICYQILFTSINDALPEFATLKAMGYPNRFFVGVVIRQTIYLSIIGFVPAFLLSLGFFQLLETLAGLPMIMTLPRAAAVLSLTVTMCLVSGLLALRKLIAADPASLF